MSFKIICATAALLAADISCAVSAYGDGLIFQLPPDGTWAEFSSKGSPTMEMQVPNELMAATGRDGQQEFANMLEADDLRRTLRVSSVGREKWAQRACRWIEFSGTSAFKKKSDGRTSADTHTLKLLIPEVHLQRNRDPLDNAVLSYWNPKEADLKGIPEEKGFDRSRYEIDRLISFFSPPLRDERQRPPVTINTPVGEFRDCEVIQGISSFDRPLRNKGRWEGSIQWTIVLHADAPFGVVRVSQVALISEITETRTSTCKLSDVLVLSAKGTDAKSVLPDAGQSATPAAESK